MLEGLCECCCDNGHAETKNVMSLELPLMGFSLFMAWLVPAS